jgi:hypothetical protein
MLLTVLTLPLAVLRRLTGKERSLVPLARAVDEDRDGDGEVCRDACPLTGRDWPLETTGQEEREGEKEPPMHSRTKGCRVDAGCTAGTVRVTAVLDVSTDSVVMAVANAVEDSEAALDS